MIETRTLVMERDFAHPPEKLWRAITQPHLIAEWLLPNDFAAEQGHRFTLQSPGAPGWSGRIDCAVREIEPGRQLSYSWDTGGGEEAMPRFESVVTLTLEPVAGGTRLRMEQSGFTNASNYGGARFGWGKFLDRLERVAAALA
ncbi:SRPBCC domain-containing protein [Sphingomonas sp. NIBR02145]|uniref:SRPBCC family protein n=1 Tax=Sphingomonas sp. NIBR02145 TaxID=3014784 RepID=UPI0022B530B4|nr:SRPBCC domain-containing protein [Sphingomonas sp. NIBR02145]WHU01995.1 SRPBCC domain-containing protein [Sphingomonas sp. NIBR02145]